MVEFRLRKMIILKQLRKNLESVADPQRAKNLQRFFKTGKGEYGEGDVFLGVKVPDLRKIAKKYYSLDIKQLKELIKSKFHEERLIALFILINKYQTTNHKTICFHFYIKNMNYINNWDLVDLSAPNIVGKYLFNFARGRNFVQARAVGSPSFFATPFLTNLAKSENIWERRIAVLATFQFIKYGRFGKSLMLAKLLLNDKHDLIHKAAGWMLREVGKRDLKTEVEFLNKYYRKMPRTMLRYAIEKFPEKLRLTYLKK